jgi:hypothetical protein
LLDFVGKGIYRDVAVVSPPLYWLIETWLERPRVRFGQHAIG